ncbi:MAG: outer membrane lipoprotein-sorting protein [Gammaproteobacteria bacterium]|nr:outer membrane lipoprotein-sorting protein [Gammaproteobacteria bacterium]
MRIQRKRLTSTVDCSSRWRRTVYVLRSILLVHLAAVWALSSVPSWASGLSPEARGTEIFAQREARNEGYGDYQVDLTMVLRNALGDSSHRELRIQQLEVPEDGDKLLIVFETPKVIKGTALLSYGHKLEPDDQWLYLPAMKRVKRITSRNKSGPFLGSEFAFEDLASQELEKYRYRYLRDETLDGVACHVVERYPNDVYSGYTRQVVWLDQAELRIVQIHYYDRKESHLKTLRLEDYRLYADRFWKPSTMFMENLQTRKSTELTWGDYTFGVGLVDERDFSTNSLKRVQ